MPSSREFYENGYGDRFIDPSYYTKEISEFIQEERRLVDSLDREVQLLIEVGCMNGRYLDWAISHNKKYIGLDVVVSYIQAGKQRLANRGLSSLIYQFVVGDAAEMPHLIRPENLQIESKCCLLLFPFNSLGNMANVEQIILNLQRSQLPFLIISYETTDYATHCRLEYYRRCGFKKITVLSNEKGVCLSSLEGLKSIAYYPSYLQKICKNYGLCITTRPFSSIGLAYIATLSDPRI